MKRTLLFLSLFAFALMASAQVVEFMGVPVDGKLSTFQAKLAEKGFVYNPDLKDPDPGTRILKGYYQGEKATLHINYDATSKTVYRVYVFLEPDKKKKLPKALFKEFKAKLNHRYLSQAAYTDDKDFDGQPYYSMYFKNARNEVYAQITLYMYKVDRHDREYKGDKVQKQYNVAFAYTNVKNKEKAEGY